MSTQNPNPNPYAHPSFFPTHALVRTTKSPKQQHAACLISFRWQNHAFAGIGAGTVAVLCMNPLDLLKVKFQVSTSVRAPGGGMGRGIWFALRDIHASEGWRGLYRGLGPNMSNWGLYFLLLGVPPFSHCFSSSYFFWLLWPAIISSSVARRSGRRTDLSLHRSTIGEGGETKEEKGKKMSVGRCGSRRPTRPSTRRLRRGRTWGSTS
jgi:hypothetical protein